MAEYINRDEARRGLELINPVDYGAMWNYEAHHYVGECLRDCKDALEDIPADDVAPVVHARWEWVSEDIYRCTACNEKAHVAEVMCRPAWRHCPNCGAKMTEGDE